MNEKIIAENQLNYLATYYVKELVESDTYNIDTNKVYSKMKSNMALWEQYRERKSNDSKTRVSDFLSKLSNDKVVFI